MFKYYFYLVLGILFGIAVALIYLLGTPFSARLIIPYAIAVILVIFALTSIKVMLCRCMCNGPYAKTIIISAITFIVFALFVVGTAAIPSGALLVFLTFVGATSFGITLTTYYGFISHMIS